MNCIVKIKFKKKFVFHQNRANFFLYFDFQWLLILKNKITTLLSMNVIDVYDHVFRDKLLHNLRKRDISNWIIRWTNSFMRDRHISLTLSNATMTSRLIKTNISQNFFISSIFYLFYNVDLLKIFERSLKQITIVNFVNDINFLIYDIFTKQNC
jgi:hypothetical protein